MAISVWAAKTKKQVDGDAEAPPSKVMCSHFEKTLKKMEGNLTLMKDHVVFFALVFVFGH